MKLFIKMIIILAMLPLGACNVSVDVDDELVDTLGEAVDTFQGRDNDTASDEDSESSSEDGDEITISTPTPGRAFLATFTRAPGSGSCDWFPSTVRLYSASDKLDIENNRGQMLAAATVFQDDTFDFRIQTINDLQTRTIENFCTCEIEAYYYYQDVMSCTCEDSDGNTCAIRHNETI